MAQLTGYVKRRKKISSKSELHEQCYPPLDFRKCKTDPHIKTTKIKNMENRQIIKPPTHNTLKLEVSFIKETFSDRKVQLNTYFPVPSPIF